MSGGRTALLWLGVVAAPLAWAAQLAAGYAVEELGCAPGGGEGEVVGVPTDTVALVITIGALALALGGAAAAATTWRRDGTRPSYVAFLGFTGLLASALFLLAIVLGGAGILALDPCEAS